MAQTGNFSPIQLYSSSTPGNAPAVGNLVNSTLGSELAINIADGKLFYKDSSNAVQVIAWKVTPATAGGTGQTSYAVGDLLYADTTTTLAKLADVATGNALISGGVGVAPFWGKIGLTTHVNGTLPVANGGTNLTSFTSGGVLYASSTSALATASTFVYSSGTNTLTAGTFSSSTGAPGFSIPNQGTGPARLNLTNTGGTVYIGLDSSVGGLTTPYALNLYHTGAYPICFATNNVERMRVNAGAPILCLSGGNTSATGTGIAFPATPSLSTDVNTLDDYKEGTYTPTVTAASGTFTTVSATGKYLKIGNQVTVNVKITITSVGTASGRINYTLPYTPTANEYYTGAALELSAAGIVGATFATNTGASIVKYDYSGVVIGNSYVWYATVTYFVS